MIRAFNRDHLAHLLYHGHRISRTLDQLPQSKQRRSFRRRVTHENHLALVVLAGVLPSFAAAVTLLWLTDFSTSTRWTLTGLMTVFLFGGIAAMRHRVRFPLQTLSNLVAGMREGDFSTRARGTGSVDAMSELAAEVNALAAQLRGQRLDSMEAAALLRTVMAEIDVAVFAFDPEQRLMLLNRAGEKVLGRSSEQLLGRSATELGLSECLEGEANRILTRPFPGAGERWSMRRGTFRQAGLQNHLLVLTDLSRALREEERKAWQRLLRVLGHELNNSLAPIKSITGSLENLLAANSKPQDWEDDLRSGLSVISSRTAALTRFMEGYSRLAKLPSPRLQKISLQPLLDRVVNLEQRLKISVDPGPPVTLSADPDQLEQLLINLLRNAVDAALENKSDQATPATFPGVRVAWSAKNRQVEIRVEDNGPGIANPANLFVPFFTTKPGGSGIGLVLSRQIAEAHGGSLILENRKEQNGCIARLRLRLHPGNPIGGTG
jgi:two-component system nitrogen regulation sensor histidine kinase NtrY